MSTLRAEHAEPEPAAILDAVCQYHRLGLNVLPVLLDEDGGQRPAVSPSRWWTTRQRLDDAIAMFALYPDAKPAIVTGRISGVVSVDTDSARGERELRRLGLPVPPTAAWATPHGTQRLYRHFGTLPTRIRLRPDLDVLAERHYTLVPPTPGRAVLVPFDEVADLPDEVARFVRRSPRATPRPAGTPTLPGLPPSKNIITWGEHPQGNQDLHMAELAAAYADPAAVRRISRVLGIEAPPDKAFRCVLPGHRDRRPSAAIHRVEQYHLYHDFHAQSGEPWYSLAEVRASLSYGRAVRLRGPEESTWSIRLQAEAGIIVPAIVSAPALPSGAPAHVQRVWSGILLLFGCKWRYRHDPTTVLTRRFLSAWCGVSEDAAIAARTWLTQHRYLVPAGTILAAYGQTLTRYRIGSGLTRQAS